MKFEDIIMQLYPQRCKGVKPNDIPWSNPDYDWSVKYDGDRRYLYILPGGNRNSSKSKGTDTGLPVEKTDNVPHIRDLDIPELYGTLLDCEFVHNRGFQKGVRKIMGCLPEKAIQRQEEWGWIEVRVFDIIALKGEMLHDKTYLERKEILTNVMDYYFDDVPFMNQVEYVEGTEEELKEIFANIVLKGGEGLVAKRKNSTYRISTEKCLTPLKNNWIKVKRDFNGDFVVTGFEPATVEYKGDHLDTHQYWMDTDGEKLNLNGSKEAKQYEEEIGDPLIPITKYHYFGWIGKIKFAEYENGELVERGVCSGFDEKLRKELTANPDKYIGKVIEVDAMERIPDTKALRQPVFKRFRDDKLPEECEYEMQKG